MKKQLTLIVILMLSVVNMLFSANFIPANDPNIQYFGRWDFSDPLAPVHSWPGVYICARFAGTGIGIQLTDNFCYYNVFIDGELKTVFHNDSTGTQTCTLVSGLPDGEHTILFTKRNETFQGKYSFHGFILDDEQTLLPPPAKPARKIEFIGDSFTSASGNEYDKNDKPANDAPITNIYEGFGPIVARHYHAQYQMTCRAGFGLVHDWQGNPEGNVPDHFDQTLLSSEQPKWNFRQWTPDLVVIGLGLNDYSGFGGWQNEATGEDATLYKTEYHQFISQIRNVYPGVKILAVAPHVEWLQKQISEVVSEEIAEGNTNVFYAFYPYFEDGYVYGEHPSVATHHKIAEILIEAIDKMKVW